MKVNKKETLRYLGYQGQVMDQPLADLFDATIQEIEQIAAPKSIYRSFPCKVTDTDLVKLAGLTIKSKHLSKNLRGCEEVILFAATIGSAVDQMIKRASFTNLAKASIVQAAGAALIETYCDELEEQVRLDAQKRELYLRPRFSPGYGDCPLSIQKDLFNIMECSKRIGITLTDTYLMYPSKSVTAFIGLCTKENKTCHKNKCMGCENNTCEYRSNE